MNEKQVFSFIVHAPRTASCLEAKNTLKISMKRADSASDTKVITSDNTLPQRQ